MGSWTRRLALRSADHHPARQALCIVWGLDTLGTSLVGCNRRGGVGMCYGVSVRVCSRVGVCCFLGWVGELRVTRLGVCGV